MSALLNQIQKRIDSGMACDHPGECMPVQPPISSTVLEQAEQRIGFRLPELLRRMYTEIGNGGFGPAFGLIPISEESLLSPRPLGAEFTLVQEYRGVRNQRQQAGKQTEWPRGVIHAFYCGCTTFEFIDCLSEPSQVFWYDEGSEALSILSDRQKEGGTPLKERLESWASSEI